MVSVVVMWNLGTLEGHSSRDLTGHLLLLALFALLPLLVPVLQTLWECCVLLLTSSSLHKLLIGRLLSKRPLSQQLHHVILIQNLLLQQPLGHLEKNRGIKKTDIKPWRLEKAVHLVVGTFIQEKSDSVEQALK